MRHRGSYLDIVNHGGVTITLLKVFDTGQDLLANITVPTVRVGLCRVGSLVLCLEGHVKEAFILIRRNEININIRYHTILGTLTH